MKNNIPKSFQLGGLDFKVKHGNFNSEGNLGHCDFFENEIIVRNKYNGKPINKQQQTQTFYHELVHAILMVMNQHELNTDEQFVDTFGQFLYQFSKSAKWK